MQVLIKHLSPNCPEGNKRPGFYSRKYSKAQKILIFEIPPEYNWENIKNQSLIYYLEV